MPRSSNGPRSVTLADVARYAGVSTAVVSYVVNNGPRPVAPDTADRVRDAIAVLGLALSVFFVRETRAHAHLEAATGASTPAPARSSLSRVFYITSLGNASLFAACQAGLVNNLNDGLAWGLAPLYLAAHGASVREIAVVAAAYPVVWGAGQLVTGWLSDHVGRKPLIVGKT